MPHDVIVREPSNIFMALVLLAILVGALIGTLVRDLRKAFSERDDRMERNRER